MAGKKTSRAMRIGDQIARDVAALIRREVRDPRVGLVTITGCDVTPDYAHAKVFFTTLDQEPEQTQAGLNAAAGMLRNHLYKALHIHTVPTLHFVLDESTVKGFEMDLLIKKAMQKTEHNEEEH